MRYLFYKFAVISILFILLLSYYSQAFLWAFIFFIPLIVLGFLNTFQNSHAILRNFPLLGYFRYLFETIAPEIQQYFIERTTDGKPFSRNHRALVYRRAKGVNDSFPLGHSWICIVRVMKGFGTLFMPKSQLKNSLGC